MDFNQLIKVFIFDLKQIKMITMSTGSPDRGLSDGGQESGGLRLAQKCQILDLLTIMHQRFHIVVFIVPECAINPLCLPESVAFVLSHGPTSFSILVKNVTL